MTAIDFDYFGDKVLDRQLRQLHPTLQKKLGRQALRRSLKAVVQPKARQLVPVDTGRRRSNIKTKAMRRSRTRVGYVVTSGGDTKKGNTTDFTGETYYGGFVE